MLFLFTYLFSLSISKDKKFLKRNNMHTSIDYSSIDIFFDSDDFLASAECDLKKSSKEENEKRQETQFVKVKDDIFYETSNKKKNTQAEEGSVKKQDQKNEQEKTHEQMQAKEKSDQFRLVTLRMMTGKIKTRLIFFPIFNFFRQSYTYLRNSHPEKPFKQLFGISIYLWTNMLPQDKDKYRNYFISQIHRLSKLNRKFLMKSETNNCLHPLLKKKQTCKNKREERSAKKIPSQKITKGQGTKLIFKRNILRNGKKQNELQVFD